ncbi:class I lanthipeptide [uncultured Kordia sp.]|uniref:class I lanthipeptide n=1 Tax=uncultured Kordia sp. TaxID=507699 RepID=UPI002639A854|nr:class I lanthipeptide [uncultured Kordia sp.]
MKKKNLNNLQLKKATISSLNSQEIAGGTIIITFTIERPCPIRFTKTTCSGAAECNSMEICTATHCKTNEIDLETRPIC